MRMHPITQAIPAIRGRVQAGAALAPFTWFRVGGPAEWLVRPADLDDLLLLLRDLPDTIPLTIIGAASNLIIRDADILGEMGKAGLANAAISITTLDRKLAAEVVAEGRAFLALL